MNKDLVLVVVLVVALLLVVCGGLALLGGLAFWLVWNHIAVPLFQLEKIGYWTAVLLCWAVSFLLGLIFRTRGALRLWDAADRKRK